MEQFIIDNVVTVFSTLFGAGIGGFITYKVETGLRNKETKNKQRHAAIVLYSDLLSIENYFKESNSLVDIRYNSQWQELMAGCNLLGEQEIVFLFKFYDCIYDYNHWFKIYENEKTNALNKERVNKRFEEIREKVNSEKFKLIVSELKSVSQ